MQLGEMIGWAVIGGVWRYIDGRGYGPGWVRLVACIFLASVAARHIPWWQGSVFIGALFGVTWLFRQRQREELDDMALRWILPFGIIGLVVVLFRSWSNFSPTPGFILLMTGATIALFVWLGATRKVDGADSSAIAETASGALAFSMLYASTVI